MQINTRTVVCTIVLRTDSKVRPGLDPRCCSTSRTGRTRICSRISEFQAWDSWTSPWAVV